MNPQLIKKLNTSDHTLVIWDGDNFIGRSGIGVKPLMTFLREDKDFFHGKEVADTIIGKAAALLLVASGASAVYGQTMSRSAINLLDQYQIPYGYETLVDHIQNRDKTGLCPLEDAVQNINEPSQAFDAVENRIQELMNGSYKPQTKNI